jgi:hypothetical protein
MGLLFDHAYDPLLPVEFFGQMHEGEFLQVGMKIPNLSAEDVAIQRAQSKPMQVEVFQTISTAKVSL